MQLETAAISNHLPKLGVGAIPRSSILQICSDVGDLFKNILLHAPIDNPADNSFWKKDSEGKNDIAQGMGSVFLSLLVTSHLCDLDLRICILKKIQLNGQKYPVNLCKERSGKYTMYSDVTGITKDNQNMQQFSSEFSGDTSTIQGITTIIRHFSTERNWSKFHTPRNIALALLGELGELAEIFQWKDEEENGLKQWREEDLDHVAQELADVAIYLLRLADVCEVDLGIASLSRAR